jgi:putative oxidoreductase
MADPSSTRASDLGLLILRAGYGVMFIGHGWPKLIGGPEKWTKLGSAMEALGVTAFPTAFGLAAALAEFGGGVLLVLGLATRSAAVALLATMVVASAMHLRDGDGFPATSHSIEAAIVFLALLWLGPGRWVVALPRPAAKPSAR